MHGCAAIILAAGGSLRLGRPKQLLVFEGETLLARAVRVATESKARPVIVVLGALADECANAIAGQPVRIVTNKEWKEGIASSIRAGLEAVAHETDAAVILLCDQPGLSAAHVDALIAAGKSIAASAYGGSLGTPAYFEKEFFPELLALRGDTGARALFKKYADKVAPVDFPGGLRDIDTPEDAARLEA